MNTAKREAIAAIAKDVIEHYVRTGKESLVKEVRKRTGYSERIIREALTAEVGRSLQHQITYLPTYSRDYPMMQHGTKSAWIYGPSRATLRSLLIEAREDASHYAGVAPGQA